MAYTPSSLNLVVGAPLAAGGRTWQHASADAAAAVDTDGFISDARSRGLRVNDYVDHRDTGTNITTRHRVAAINANGSANLADGTVVSSGTNTD